MHMYVLKYLAYDNFIADFAIFYEFRVYTEENEHDERKKINSRL